MEGTAAHELRSEKGERSPIINKEAFAQDIVNKKANDLIDKAEAEKRGKDVLICSLHDPVNYDDDEGYLLIDTISESSTFYEYNAMSFTQPLEFDIDMKFIIEKLPADLQELYQLLQIMSIDDILKIKKISRRTFYRKLKFLRQILSDSGISN